MNKTDSCIMHEWSLSSKIFFSLFLMLVLLLSIFNKSTYATASTLTLSVTNNVSLDIASTNITGTFAHSDTVTPNIRVRTTNGSGYTLGIRANTTGVNNNALINTQDNTKIIPSITVSGGISESTYSSDSSYNNTWAYRPSKLNSLANSNYLPAPNSNSTPVVLDQTNVSNPSSDNTYNISLGVRVNNSITPGSYSGVFVVTAIASPIPYTITYNKNTSDTVTNLPSNESSSTYGETITLSNQIPVRDGYNFKGWCSVMVADDALCSGTTYNPDGDGTSLSYTIDQTQPSAALTIYAMWETTTTGSCNPSGTTIGTNTNTDILCMQDFASLSTATKAALTNSMTTGTQYTLLDKRDDKSYTISKLLDGKVWMTQNLDLDLDSSITYTNEDTDLGWNTNTNTYDTASWTPLRSTYATTTNHIHQWCVGGTYDSGSCIYNNTPESYDPGDLYWNETASGWIDWFTYEDTCNHTTSTPSCDETQNPLDDYTTHVGTPTTQLHFGNYYNWTAAIASNDASGYNGGNDGYQEVNQSICPAGWKLPYSFFNSSTGQNLGDFADLLAEYSWPVWSQPLYIVSGGNYTGYIDRVGLSGLYWSNVVHTLDQAQNLFFWAPSGSEDGLDPAAYNNRSEGLNVRCLLR